MTREEVAEVITYCKTNDISYKTRLAELGIPSWKFYDSKSWYALEQESSEAKGEFLQLYAGGSSVPMLSFAATSGKKAKGRKDSPSSHMLSIELRTYAEASLPQKSQFLLPRANGRMARSTGLLSIDILPSLT